MYIVFLNNISYGNKNVLTNLSLSIEAGEFVAITGKSGKGNLRY